MVLFVVENAHYRFLYIDIGKNGRINDSHILKNSKFYKALQGNNLRQPNKTVFVGDDAFPSITNIMKAIMMLICT